MFITMNLSLICQDSLQLMIVTGGHEFDRPSFFAMFADMSNVGYEEIQQPLANEMIAADGGKGYDAIVFYDMYDSITDEQKKGYLSMISQEKPLLFLHHALVSYQDWPTFKNIVGGKYHTSDTSKESNYHHDEQINVKVLDPAHPVTNGVHNFEILDETYGDCEINSDVKPLLSTDHPLSMAYLGWVNHFSGHNIVYLQGGHGPSAYADPNFRKILEQAIRWLVVK